MMRRGGRRMRGGKDTAPGGFPGSRRGEGSGRRRRGPRLSQAERVAQIAKRRGVSTEQASELFKQRKEKRRETRKGERMERRTERVAERRSITKEDAQKLIADRAARRQERRTVRGDRVADGTVGNGVSRQERIAGRKKEILARIREKMGMGEGKRAEFEERVKNRGRRGLQGRRESNYDMKGGVRRRVRDSEGVRGGRGARRGMRRRMRGGREQTGTMVGS